MSSQVRKHTKTRIKHRIRHFIQGLRIKKIGRGVFLDDNIKLLRFPKSISIDDFVMIKEGARICSCNENSSIHIGANTTVGFHTFIYASESITIGSNCLIAPFVYIVDSDHGIAKDQPINQQSNYTSPVVIEDDVWIGTGAKILKGVRIGEGSIIAAGSVVKEDTEPYAIYGGIPAKKISERK